MKKFLFTLAALFMAGSAFANDYWYVTPFEVTADMCGTTVEVPVAAHFESRVSSGQFEIFLPEGFEIVDYLEGEDATISYFTATGRERTVDAGFTTTNNKEFIVITSATVQGYYQVDGAWTSYGAIKWEPGEYDEMLLIYVAIPADFDYTQKNVEMSIYSQPACGQDPRGNTTNGETSTNITYINEATTPTPEAFVGTASVVFNENVATISYTSNDPNADVVVTVNGTETEVNWNRAAGTATWTAPINTTPGQYSYTVKLTVTPDGENFVGEPVSAQDTYAYEVLEKTATPVITIVEEHHNWVSFDVDGDGTVLVYVDGNLVEPAEDGHYYVYASTEADVTYVVTATAQENGKEISDTATETIEIAKWDAVNELVNGKTIANVRYFNMAGQEMQSVNGMTIKVITYTDGTTSAVKVMK